MFNIKKIVHKKLLLEYETNHFNPILPDKIKENSARYEGRNVIWYGTYGKMVVIHKDDVYGMWGNVYDNEKFNELVNLITNYPEKVELETSYGIGDVVTLTNVMEEQHSTLIDRFEIDYEGQKEAVSTGNEELDKYLGSEDIDDIVFDYLEGKELDDEVYKFIDKNRFFLYNKKKTTNEIINEFKLLIENNKELMSNEEVEDSKEAFESFLNYEKEIIEAVNDNWGDLGDFRVQLRDGHHRVMAAIESGEEYICVDLTDETIKDYKGHYKLVN